MSGPQYQLIELDRLKQDKLNMRKSYRGIEGLAETIFEHGLLQNLVVEPDLSKEGDFVVVAGNRRLKALQLLKETGRLADPAIPCLVRTADRHKFAQAIENVQRDDVPIWDIGARFAEYEEAGLSHSEIGAIHGKHQTYVSRATTIFRGLHPKTIETLRKVPETLVPRTFLERLAAVPRLNEFGDIDEKRQADMLGFLLNNKTAPRRGRKRRGEYTNAEKVMFRLLNLKKASVPKEHYRTYSIIMAYLTGRGDLDWDSDGLFI